MRISDWSSDVCSSDLPNHDRYVPSRATAVRFTGVTPSGAWRFSPDPVATAATGLYPTATARRPDVDAPNKSTAVRLTGATPSGAWGFPPDPARRRRQRPLSRRHLAAARRGCPAQRRAWRFILRLQHITVLAPLSPASPH